MLADSLHTMLLPKSVLLTPIHEVGVLKDIRPNPQLAL